MTLILLGFILICFLHTKIDLFNKEYISRNTTVQINGIFVFLVLMSHFAGYLDENVPFSFIYMNVRGFFAQLVVTTFLFYSGYGVLVSINKKPKTYINTIPVKVLELIVNFSLAILLFVIVQSFFGNTYPVSKIALSCIGWSSVGNSNWYLFDILLLYMITYVSFKCTKKRYLSLLLVLVLSLVSMFFLFKFQNGTRWYNTFLCFWLGMVYAQFKNDYESVVQKDKNKYYVTGAILLLGFLAAALLRKEMFFYILHAMIFTLLINHLSMMVHLDNPVLKWLGSHIFSIYILQRIPMIIGDHISLIHANMFVYFFFTLCITIVLAEGFDRLLQVISKRVFVPIKTKVNEG